MSSRQILSAGIFATEPGQRLLTISDMLAHRAFEGLYAKCRDNVNGTYYQTGLKRVHVWSDDIVKEDIAFVCRTCPDMEETYERCFVNYVEERFCGSSRPVVQCPPVLRFVRRFLESVALHEYMQTAEYFTTRDIVQRRITCIDAARQAFYSIVNADSVRMEMESVASRATTAPPPGASNHHRGTASRSVVLESEEDDIHPSDSISQVAVPESVVSVRARREDEELETRGTSPPPSPQQPYPPPPSDRRDAARGTQDDHQTHRGDRRDDGDPLDDDLRNGSSKLEVAPPPPPSSYISTASSTSRRRVDDVRAERREADDKAVRRYKPELLEADETARSDVSRHDFEMVDGASVASLRTRSVIGSRDSSVSIGMKRIKSPHAR